MKEERDIFEKWLDRHNHKMELLRTAGNMTVIFLQSIILTVQIIVLAYTVGVSVEKTIFNILFEKLAGG